MKVYLRDRITAGLGVSVLAVLAAMSYYYSIHTETEALRAEIIRVARLHEHQYRTHAI